MKFTIIITLMISVLTFCAPSAFACCHNHHSYPTRTERTERTTQNEYCRQCGTDKCVCYKYDIDCRECCSNKCVCAKNGVDCQKR